MNRKRPEAMTKTPPEPPFPTHIFEQAFERAPVAPPAPPRRRRSLPIFTPKVVICTMFGTLSAGYIAVAFTSPDWLADLSPAQSQVARQTETSVHTAAALAQEIGALKSSVAQLQSDVTSVRSDVDRASAQQTALATELTSLNSRVASSAQAVAQPPPLPAPQTPKLINSDGKQAEAPLETGSVAHATTAAAAHPEKLSSPAAFGPAVVKPAPKPVGIQISSGPTVEGLRVSWSLLSDNYGAELKNLQPRFSSRGDPANPTYDLVAGPVKTKAQAVKLCKALSEKSVPCTVTEEIGDPL